MIIKDNKYEWIIKDFFFEMINIHDMKVLVIVGPSGVGKTTFAEYIINKYKKFCLIKNTTTRKKRLSDNTSQFDYVDEKIFNEYILKNKLIWARTSIHPCYGYRYTELEKAMENKKIPILMFRNSGAEILDRIIKKGLIKEQNIFFVFLEAEIERILSHSCDQEGDLTIEKIERGMTSNRVIFQSLKKDVAVLKLYNNYDKSSFNDIDKFVEGIILNDR